MLIGFLKKKLGRNHFVVGRTAIARSASQFQGPKHQSACVWATVTFASIFADLTP